MEKKYTRSKRSAILKLARDPMFRQRVVGAKKGTGSYKREKINVNEILNDDLVIEELSSIDYYEDYE